jgi:hypothetical protein
MQAIDVKRLKDILKDIDEALLVVARKHGLRGFVRSNVKYTQSEFHFKLQSSVEGTIEEGALNGEAITYNRWRARLGLPPLGSKFIYKSKVAEIIGLRIGGPVKNVIFLSDNKRFKVKDYLLEDLMNREHRL